MSALRIIGIFIGLTCIGISFFRLRSFSDRRTDVWILIPFGLILVIIALFPGLVNIPADIISLGDLKGGRLITLLIISNILIWLLLIYQRSKFENWHFQFDKWVRRSTVDEFLKTDTARVKPGSIVVIIPAYNEERNVGMVLPRIPDQIRNRPVTTLLIDDGSTDDTAAVSRKHGALVAVQKANRGGGAALKTGYEIVKRMDPAVIVTMDADGQHDPAEIEFLVEPIINGQSDFVIGSRILGRYDRYSRLRIYGVTFFSKIINAMSGTQITDCSSGFRAFNKAVLENCQLSQEQYHTPELIIQAAKRGFRIHERPVIIKKRLSGKSKKGRNMKYAFFFLRTILKSWLR